MDMARLLINATGGRLMPGRFNGLAGRRGNGATIGGRPGGVNTIRVSLALLLAFTFASAIPPPATAQPQITGTRIRDLARQASREAHGDATDLVMALDRRVRETWGDFESFPLSIVRDEQMLVTLTPPYLGYRRSLMDMLRTGRPIEQAVWTGTVEVAIGPRRLDAPDIESVELTRDARPIAPVQSTLRPMTFSDASGTSRAIHSGEILFDPSAFAPGAVVTLTLHCAGAPAIVHTFDAAQLSALR
jgi:hypothetical protein